MRVVPRTPVQGDPTARRSIKAFNRVEITSAAAYAEGIDRFEAAFPRSGRTPTGSDTAGAKPPIRSHLGLFEIVAVCPPGEAATNPDMAVVVLDGFGGPDAGAHVIATASAHNLDRVRRLGADVVVDYRTQRFEDFAHDVDVVVDTGGGQTRERSRPLIRRGGVLASLQPPPPDQTVAQQHGVRAFMVHGDPDIGELLPEITRRLESGELAFPEIGATFPLDQAAQAHHAFESGSARGKIVLVVPD